MNRHFFLVVAVAAIAGCGGGGASSSSAGSGPAPPGQGSSLGRLQLSSAGRVVFHNYSIGLLQNTLWGMNSDGTGAAPLAAGGSDPSISANGGLIAYDNQQNAHSAVFLMSGNGAGKHPLFSIDDGVDR